MGPICPHHLKKSSLLSAPVLTRCMAMPGTRYQTLDTIFQYAIYHVPGGGGVPNWLWTPWGLGWSNFFGGDPRTPKIPRPPEPPNPPSFYG